MLYNAIETYDETAMMKKEDVALQTGAVVLAAGESQISNIPMLRREMDVLREVGISPVVVVTGYRREEVEKELAHRKVRFVNNPEYGSTNMIASLRLGLKELVGSCQKVVVVPADVPSFRRQTLQLVMQQPGDLSVPSCHGKTGHPICISMDIADRILQYHGDEGMRGLMKEPDLRVCTVEVEDPGILLEADSEQSWRESQAYEKQSLEAHPIHPILQIGLGRTETCFDGTLARFLEQIQKDGSMNQACKSAGMAYSHGWKMIKYAEEQLGFRLVRKKTGGASGGGTGVTEEGKVYLQRYREWCHQVERYAETMYQRCFFPEST